MLLMNLCQGLLQSSVLHKEMAMANRLENALVSHVFLDLCHLLAADREKEWGVKTGSLFSDRITIRNMKELAGCVAIAAMAIPDGYAYRPFRMNELPIEQHFGALRGQFSSSQMSVRDFVTASANSARKAVAKQSKTGKESVHIPQEKALSHEEFQQCADRAFSAAISLMEMSSDFSAAYLRKRLGAYYAACPTSGEWEDALMSWYTGIIVLFV